MLGGQGIQPVTVKFNNSRNCFLELPSTLISQLSLQETQVLELSWGHSTPVYLSWTRCRRSSNQEGNTVEVNSQLGDKLGIKDGEQGFLRPCYQVLSVQQVFVDPLTSDDWEILELHSTELEEKLLDQIRVVFPGGVFPVWVDQNTVIYIRIASLSPAVPYGRLEQFTELAVSPRLRKRTPEAGALSGWPRELNQNQRLQRQGNFEVPHPINFLGSDSSATTLEFPEDHLQHGRRMPGASDLKSLVRSMFSWGPDHRREVPPALSVPPGFGDSVFRVCGTPPLTDVRDAALGAVHVLPWSRGEAELAGGPFDVTYGLLSKLRLPKDAKQVSETKGNGRSSPSGNMPPGSEGDIQGPLVVRMVCNCMERLLERRSCGRKGVVFSGRVWVPQSLRRRLKIGIRSAVRIQPIKSTPKYGLTVRLQPLQPFPELEEDSDIQSAFLDWLHTHSNTNLPFLTGQSGFLLMPVGEESLEFALTVLKPESESKQSDDVFLLTSILLKRTDVQIVREPLSHTVNAGEAVDHKSSLTLPSLDCLGGMEDVGRPAFEHIGHSLMAGPLSQELMSLAPGLRNGAALITGAKGSGKTVLAKALCRKAMEVLDAHVEVVDCKKLTGKRTETVRRKLEEVFEQAMWRQPSVVLLDDLDHLTGAASSLEHQHGPEAIHHMQLAQVLMDLVDDAVLHGGLIALMATSQSEHSMHPSLMEVQGSHFFQCFTSIQAPDQAQRVDILRAAIRSRPFIASESHDILDLECIARGTEGYLPRDLTLVLERAVHANALKTKGGVGSEVCLSTCDFQQALQGFIPPSLRDARLHTPTGAGLEQVGGLHEARQMMMDTILLPARYPTLFANLPIRQRSGLLLYGAPGTGKTLLAGAMAKESGMNFIAIKGPELLSKYIGASEQAVRDLFQRAQSAKPCILFFDEFDSLAPRRGHDSTGVTDRVVNQLLTQLDGVEGLQGVYVLAATSRPDLIDPALLRPGRLDKSLYCPPPDQDARLEILRALTHSVTLAGDVDLEQVAGVTEGFTGADLKALLYNAQLEAVHSSLGATLPQDGGLGSDSDVSLSSMIFLSHSSGSDDSAGEGEGVLEQSIVLLDASEVAPEEPRHNLWRLYFGSSYESELGYPSPPEPNSQCLSGPNSVTHDLTGASLRDPACSGTPAFMTSLREGYQELGLEQLEQLRSEIGIIKNNYRSRNTEESLLIPAGPSKPALLLCQTHLEAALASTRASIGRQDWTRYTQLYEAFGSSGKVTSRSVTTLKSSRVTLA